MHTELNERVSEVIWREMCVYIQKNDGKKNRAIYRSWSQLISISLHAGLMVQPIGQQEFRARHSKMQIQLWFTCLETAKPLSNQMEQVTCHSSTPSAEWKLYVAPLRSLCWLAQITRSVVTILLIDRTFTGGKKNHSNLPLIELSSMIPFRWSPLNSMLIAVQILSFAWTRRLQSLLLIRALSTLVQIEYFGWSQKSAIVL